MDGGNYVRIKEETDEKLVLVREPSSRAWAILIGLVSLGVGAAWYVNDYLLWKLAYISGMIFVGVSCFEDWEECELNKKDEQVKISKTSLLQKIIPSKEKKVVTADLCDVTRVCVEEESVRYGGKGYLVVLKFAGGYSLGITETATLGDKTEHEMIAEKIKNFLQLGKIPSSDEEEPENLDIEEIDIEEEKAAQVTDSAPDSVEKVITEKIDAPVSLVSSDNSTAAAETMETPGSPSDSSSSDEGFEKIDQSDLPTDKPQELGDEE